MNISSGNIIPGSINLTTIAARVLKITQSRVLCISFSLFLLFLPCLSVNVAHAQRVITLNFSNFFPARHKNSVVAQQWCREVERRSGGRVRIAYFPGGTLTPAAQTYDNVVKGIVDIGESCFAYTRGKFPMMEILDLPLGYQSGMQATRLSNAFYEHFRPRELDDVKVLFLHAHGPGIFHTKRPVYRLSDLRGMKIRATGMAAKIVQAHGALPIGTTMPETYDALRSGIANGAMAPIEALQGWKWGEVVSSTTQNFGSSYTTAMFVVINRAKWNSLPHDIQNLMEDISREWISKQGMVWDEIDREAYSYSQRRGNKVITLDDQESARWAAAVRPLLESQARGVKNKGLPGDEALRFCLRYLGNSYHSDIAEPLPANTYVEKPSLPSETPKETSPPVAFKPLDDKKPSFLHEPLPESPPKEQTVARPEESIRLSLDKVSISDKQTRNTSGNANSILEAGETVILHARLINNESENIGPIRVDISSETRGIRTEGSPKVKIGTAKTKKGDRETFDLQQTLKASENYRDRSAVLHIKAFGKHNAVVLDEKITLGTNPSLPLF